MTENKIEKENRRKEKVLKENQQKIFFFDCTYTNIHIRWSIK